MPQYPLQNTAFAIIAGTPLLAVCFVVLRLYARKRFGLALGWDDYLITIASVLSIGLIFPSIRNVQMWHFGIHIWDVNPMKLEPDYDEYHKVLIAFNVINTPILPLVKASIILLLLKIGKLIPSVRRILIVILVFIIGAAVGPWIALIFLCPPRTGATNAPTVFGNLKCIQQRPGAILYLWLVSVNIFTDILILPIPSILMYRVESASIRARLTVIFSSALILGATAIGATRLALTWQRQLDLREGSDWTYSITYTLMHAENNAGIILACMPILRTLIIRWHQPVGSPWGSDMIQTNSRSYGMFRDSTLIRATPTPDQEKEMCSVEVMRAEMRAVEDEWKRQDSEVGLTLPSPTKSKFSDSKCSGSSFAFEGSGFYDTE